MQDLAIDQCFKFIEDGDLWRWQLPGGKAFYAGLHARNIEFDAVKNPGVFDQLMSLQPDALVKEVHTSLLLYALHRSSLHGCT